MCVCRRPNKLVNLAEPRIFATFASYGCHKLSAIHSGRLPRMFSVWQGTFSNGTHEVQLSSGIGLRGCGNSNHVDGETSWVCVARYLFCSPLNQRKLARELLMTPCVVVAADFGHR